MISKTKSIKINENISVGADNKLLLIAGPCVIENEEMIMQLADDLVKITNDLNINFVFKASFDKANRSSINSFRGPGLEKGIEILKKVKEKNGVPITTDMHETWQAKLLAEVVDIIQIPAFLCRQTDMLLAAAKTNVVVNVKKGQFLAPWDMKNIVKKLEEANTQKIMLTERGTSFGYNNLVVDMRSLMEMRKFNYPIIFDATHSVQKPGGRGDSTGGDREFVYPLMRAATAVGIDGIFAEVHMDPDNAKSDGPNMLNIKDLKQILEKVVEINQIVKQ